MKTDSIRFVIMIRVFSINIILLLFLFSIVQAQNSGYKLKSASRGFYTVKSPYADTVKLYLFNRSNYFIPEKNEDQLIFFLPKEDVYYFSDNARDSINRRKFLTEDFSTTQVRNYYIYTLQSKYSDGNWLTWYLQPSKKDCLIRLPCQPGVTQQPDLKFYFYNFSIDSVKFDLTVNSQNYSVLIPKYGDFVFSCEIDQETCNDTLEIRIANLTGDIGIAKIFSDCATGRFETANTGIENLKEIFYEKFPLLDPRDLKTTDILIISAPKFKNEMPGYLKYLKRHNESNTISVIYTDQIQNGPLSCNAIKEVISKVRPEYLILAGDANPKEDTNNLIPTYYYRQKATGCIYATDYNFSFFVDSLNPEIIVTRLPFKSEEEFSTHLKKLRKQTVSNIVQPFFLFDSKADSLYKYSKELPDNKRKQNKNSFLLVHAGHGSIYGWSEFPAILKSKTLRYSSQIIDLSCWTGDYSNPTKSCFMEKILNDQNIRSTAIVSSTGFLSEEGSDLMIKFIIKELGCKQFNIMRMYLSMKKYLIQQKQIPFDDIRLINSTGSPF